MTYLGFAKKWNKLSQKDKDNIMIYVPKYVEATPETKYRKNPETFFNRRAWENELPARSKEQIEDELEDKKVEEIMAKYDNL